VTKIKMRHLQNCDGKCCHISGLSQNTNVATFIKYDNLRMWQLLSNVATYECGNFYQMWQLTNVATFIKCGNLRMWQLLSNVANTNVANLKILLFFNEIRHNLTAYEMSAEGDNVYGEPHQM
jgi:hypothetical protein